MCCLATLKYRVDVASFLRSTQTAEEKLGATKEKKGMTSGEAVSKC